MSGAAVQLVVQRPSARVILGAIPVSGDHDDLGAASLVWTASAHTGTASRLAGFNGAGAAAYFQIGADVQAYDAGLASLVTVDTAADLLPYTTGANAWASTSLTAFARTLLDDSTRAAVLATLGGVDVSVTPGSTTSDTTGTTVATLTLTTGKSYLITGVLICTTALASTALNTRALAGGGLTASAVAFQWSAGQTTTFAGGSTRLDDWTPLTSGLGTTERALVIHGHLTCTASGTVEIQIRSEVNGSSVAVTAGIVRLMECP